MNAAMVQANVATPCFLVGALDEKKAGESMSPSFMKGRPACFDRIPCESGELKHQKLRPKGVIHKFINIGCIALYNKLCKNGAWEGYVLSVRLGRFC